MENKNYMYQAILAIWTLLKNFGFEPIDSNDDEKWELLLIDTNRMLAKFNNPKYPRINFFVRELANVVISYYEKNPYFMKNNEVQDKAS